jgi:hypothetical protein
MKKQQNQNLAAACMTALKMFLKKRGKKTLIIYL